MIYIYTHIYMIMPLHEKALPFMLNLIFKGYVLPQGTMNNAEILFQHDHEMQFVGS